MGSRSVHGLPDSLSSPSDHLSTPSTCLHPQPHPPGVALRCLVIFSLPYNIWRQRLQPGSSDGSGQLASSRRRHTPPPPNTPPTDGLGDVAGSGAVTLEYEHFLAVWGGLSQRWYAGSEARGLGRVGAGTQRKQPRRTGGDSSYYLIQTLSWAEKLCLPREASLEDIAEWGLADDPCP